MNEEQVNLQAIQQFVEQHPLKDAINSFANQLREYIKEPGRGEAVKVAICLVGAEMAAES
jgi:hypothetical protein